LATYAIGDVQGCYDELCELLDVIPFDPAADRLWLTGDLVNRGPKSLETLRFVKSLDDTTVTVLGNHDLHLLAVAYNIEPKIKKRDTLDAILNAPDRDELLDWLRQRPLLHHDAELDYCLVHAGLPPQWSLHDALNDAECVEAVLRGPDYRAFFADMYGDQPDRWEPDLDGIARLRYAVNCFTRARFFEKDGRLDFAYKGPLGSEPAGLTPWFAFPGRRTGGQRIIFGHWASLTLPEAEQEIYRVYPLDTGCVWGRTLTAMDLESGKLTSVPSRQPPAPL
jgi:bis(5'-nucleosyl)-tetraphosphatase (symmetrical)